MKNSTLIFRSLAVIIFIAGGAHLANLVSQDQTYRSVSNNMETVETIDNSQQIDKNEEVKTTDNYNPKTDYIIGKWKVNYNSEGFKGAVIYNLKKEGKVFNAYTYTYEDDKGYSQNAKNTKTLTIKSFDGYKGKGIYNLDYEKQTYQVECQIDMVDESTFKLSYDYYGYSDIETWKRQ